MVIFNYPIFRVTHTRFFVGLTAGRQRQFTAIQTSVLVEEIEKETLQRSNGTPTRGERNQRENEKRKRQKGNCLIIPVPQNKKDPAKYDWGDEAKEQELA